MATIWEGGNPEDNAAWRATAKYASVPYFLVAAALAHGAQQLWHGRFSIGREDIRAMRTFHAQALQKALMRRRNAVSWAGAFAGDTTAAVDASEIMTRAARMRYFKMCGDEHMEGRNAAAANRLMDAALQCCALAIRRNPDGHSDVEDALEALGVRACGAVPLVATSDEAMQEVVRLGVCMEAQEICSLMSFILHGQKGTPVSSAWGRMSDAAAEDAESRLRAFALLCPAEESDAIADVPMLGTPMADFAGRPLSTAEAEHLCLYGSLYIGALLCVLENDAPGWRPSFADIPVPNADAVRTLLGASGMQKLHGTWPKRLGDGARVDPLKGNKRDKR